MFILTSCAQEKYLTRNSYIPEDVQVEINSTILNDRPFPKTMECDYGIWHYKYTFKSTFNYTGIRTRN